LPRSNNHINIIVNFKGLGLILVFLWVYYSIYTSSLLLFFLDLFVEAYFWPAFLYLCRLLSFGKLLKSNLFNYACACEWVSLGMSTLNESGRKNPLANRKWDGNRKIDFSMSNLIKNAKSWISKVFGQTQTPFPTALVLRPGSRNNAEKNFGDLERQRKHLFGF